MAMGRHVPVDTPDHFKLLKKVTGNLNDKKKDAGWRVFPELLLMPDRFHRAGG